MAINLGRFPEAWECIAEASGCGARREHAALLVALAWQTSRGFRVRGLAETMAGTHDNCMGSSTDNARRANSSSGGSGGGGGSSSSGTSTNQACRRQCSDIDRDEQLRRNYGCDWQRSATQLSRSGGSRRGRRGRRGRSGGHFCCAGLRSGR